MNLFIFGGENAQIGQFPYQVALYAKQNTTDKYLCGGSILSKRFIVTAAHCFFGEIPVSAYVIVGSIDRTNGVKYELNKISKHNGFDITECGILDDIALLRTAKEIMFTDTIQPIALPNRNTEGNIEVLVSGWGMQLMYFQYVLSKKQENVYHLSI